MRRWGDFRQDPIDDLVQDTYIKLCADQCRLLYQFSLVHPDAVEGYIRTAAINVAHDFVKSQRSQKRGNGKVGQFPEHVEPAAVAGSMGSQSAIEHTILMRQIEQCLEQCTEESSRSRDCLIFWLHYQQGMTASHIASLSAVGLTVKGVESVIHRLTRQVRERLAQFETQKNVKPRLEGFGRA
jgi:RNA polymerase sigma-70 factor (ECF subfamily)